MHSELARFVLWPALLFACSATTGQMERSTVPYEAIDVRAWPAADIEAQTVVFSDAANWQRFWSDKGQSPPEAPSFSRGPVAAIFAGSRSSAGYSIEFQSVTRAADEAVVIEYSVTGPRPGEGSAAVITYPRVAVQIPAAGVIRFVHHNSASK